MVEAGADDAGVAVWPSDLAPDDSDLAALSLLGGSVDVCDALSEVEPVCGLVLSRSAEGYHSY